MMPIENHYADEQGECPGVNENVWRPAFERVAARRGISTDQLHVHMIDVALLLNLTKLCRHMNGIGEKGEKLRGMKVLCLGCGCTGGPWIDARVRRKESKDAANAVRLQYEPWTPRCLHEMGAEVVAVDLGNLNGEAYESHSGTDLTNPEALRRFKDNSFDAIIMDSFYDIAVGIRQDAARITIQLIGEIRRILKPGGAFMSDDSRDISSVLKEFIDRSSPADPLTQSAVVVRSQLDQMLAKNPYEYKENH